MAGIEIAARCRVASIGAIAVGAMLAPMTAQAAEAPALNPGNAAWMLTSTALVLFMTLPGLAMFYAGLVRARNALSVLMHCFVIACLVSVLWFAVAYSLAFSDGGGMNAYVGGLGKLFMTGVGLNAMQGDIPETVFFMFQMTFAIITPGLIVGAYPERIRFAAMVLFSGLWLIVVYAPVAHWVWGGGWLAQLGVLDFAGGLVVHLTAGVSSLVVAVVLGKRSGFPNEVSKPHSPGMTMMGAGMLWVGWFGFNAGSALAAGANAGMAMTVTHISAATAALTWMTVEWRLHRRPSLVGIATGAVAGLATITPASGFVGPVGAFCIGITAGLVCYRATPLIKQTFKIDDSLDVFAVHGVGGMTGVLLTAIFASPALGGLGLAEGMTVARQFGVQAIGVAAVAAWAALASFILLKIVGAMVGLRVSREAEMEGLDITSHGERAYDL
jgi:Amt family ammonium transporter